jgi:hypothetical protein
MVGITLVLVGGFNWLSAVFMKKDMVQTLFGNGLITKAIYLAVGIAALSLFLSRDIYLPFLGETLVPSAAFATRTPDNANQEVNISVAPNTKVLYWAAEPKDASSNSVNNWDAAYTDYTNSGVTISDDKGTAILRIRGSPQSYKVPFKGELKPHIHYRIAKNNGMMGPVETYFLNNGKVEPFKNYF